MKYHMQYHVVFGIIMYHAVSWNVHIMLMPPQLPPGVHTAHASWYMSWSQSRATNQRTNEPRGTGHRVWPVQLPTSPFLEEFLWPINQRLHKKRWGVSKFGTFHDVVSPLRLVSQFLVESSLKKHSHWWISHNHFRHFRSWPALRHFDLSVFLFLLIGMIFVQSSVEIDPSVEPFRFSGWW